MPDQIKRMDVLHEAAFSEPSFVLLREFPPVIKKFYEVLSTRFSVSPAYTTINSTNTVADLTIRIGLFNNSAAIELRPDRMAVSLPNITSRDELIVVKDTLSLAHNALKGALPETTLSTSKFTLNTWISLEGGAIAAEDILTRCASPSHPLDASKWGATSSRNSLRLTSRNDAEGWDITIYGDPSLVQGSHLFLSLDLTVSRANAHSINEQVAVAETKLPQIFEAIGLNLPKQPPTTGQPNA